MHKDQMKRFVLLVLVILTVFLGILVYKKTNVQLKNQNSNSNPEVLAKIDPNVFSSDEIKLLTPPEREASKIETDEHSKLAAKLAVIGNQVEIKNCKSNPIVLQTKSSSKVTFKNNSDYNITISFDKNNVLDVGIGKSVSTDKAFIHGQGLYGYLCHGNNFTGLIGFILLTP